MSVLIVGGGIGGLAAAVALRRVGIAAQVFERAPEIHEIGAAIVDDVYDRRPRRRWGRGRVSLLGDAAHPTTPTYGQGACMAIEDAVVLADSLRRGNDPVTALRSYESRRRRRTAMMTRLSWRDGKILQYEHPALVRWRTLAMSTRVSRWNSDRILRWFLRHDVPELDRATAVV